MLQLLLLSLLTVAISTESRQPVWSNRPRHLIVGGEPAPLGRYPFFAGLQNFPDQAPFCGGTLIAPNVVLTAAHCLNNRSPKWVTVGCQDFSDLSSLDCEVLESKNVLLPLGTILS